MFRNSTTIHPPSLQRTSQVWSGNENLSTIKDGKDEVKDRLMESRSKNRGGSEIGPTLEDWEFFISNIDNNGVIPEEEGDLPPPGQGQPRVQLQTIIKLPSIEFCLTRALPDLNLVMELEDEEVQVLKIDLPQFLGFLSNLPQPLPAYDASSDEDTFRRSLPPLTTTPFANSTGAGEQDEGQVANIDLHNSLQSLTQPPLENESFEEAEGPEDENVDILTPFSHQLIPRPSNPNGSGIQVPSPHDVFPQKKLRPRTQRSNPRNKKEVTRTGVKVNPRVGDLHRSRQEKIDGREGWPYPCSFCHKGYYTLSHLKVHILVHTTEKPYSCDKCGRQFNQTESLTSHQRLHDPASRRPFPCEDCGKTFTQKRHLIRHKNFMHVRHFCPEPNCGISFGFKSILVFHQKTAHAK